MIPPLPVANFIEHIRIADTDPAVGIYIIKMKENDPMGHDIPEPGLYRSITAYYYKRSMEIYPIIHGAGTIHTGLPSPNDSVRCNRSVDLNTGFGLTVDEGIINPWENIGSELMTSYFICRDAHIGHDRFIVRGAIP